MPSQRIVLFAMFLGLSGCAGLGDHVGKGPLDLSPQVERGYQVFVRDYVTDFSTGYFAVSPDGQKYGFSYCPDLNCRGNYQSLALRACNRGRASKDCRLYARGGEVIWRFDE